MQLLRKIAPELISTVEERYIILRHIQYAQPVGRRALASLLNLGERAVRAQTEFLKTAGLIEVSALGMKVTVEGQTMLKDLANYVKLQHGLTTLENELATSLRINKVVIIPGDSDTDEAVSRELGRAAASVLAEYLGNNMTIAVSGGSTVAQVAKAVTGNFPSTTIVPARGGLGERVEYQANTIAAVMATRLGGHYRLLHIPDGVSEEALEVLLTSDDHLAGVIAMVKHADVLIHGIGQAAAMAGRRRMDPAIVAQMTDEGAVGEALGHYCTVKGKVVHVTSSLGLTLNDLAEIGVVIAVAGGRAKAEAIVAVATAGGQDVLVTDEAAAKAIQTIINKKQ